MPIIQTKCGDTLYHKGNILMEVKSPCYSDQFTGKNNNSIVLMLRAHHKSILFTGDIEKQAENWLSQQINTSVDVLKVPHHGSSSSSSQTILTALRPEKAIISCGLNNRFGFPHQDPLKRLQKYASSVYYTSKHGAVMYRISARNEAWDTMQTP